MHKVFKPVVEEMFTYHWIAGIFVPTCRTMADLLYGHESYTVITDQFKEECEKLQPVELVKRDGFSLMQGVHAMEMNHHRMDTGLQYKSLEHQLETAPKVTTADDVLKLINLLFSREMSWHSGPMLIQNVFSCWYVERVLQEIKFVVSDLKTAKTSMKEYLNFEISSWDDIFKIYILIMIKTISTCADLMISSPSIYPDEDIVLEKSFYLMEETDPESLLSIARSGIDYIKKTPENSSQELEQWLEFRIQLLEIFIVKIQDTSKARKISEKLKGYVTDDASPFSSTFSIHIQTRIDYPCPLRPLTSIDISEAWEYLDSILQLIQEFRDIYFKLQRATDRMSYIVSFGARKPVALPIVRAILATTISGEEWVVKNITEVIGPDALKDRKNSDLLEADELKTIILTAAGIYEALLICCCQNKSRRRQNFSHAIILWDNMQAMVEAYEEKLIKAKKMDFVKKADGGSVPALPLSSWVYMRKLQIMIWTVLLGFELEIYAVWEFPVMWGYAYYLMNINNEHSGRMRTYLQSKIQQNKKNKDFDMFSNAHRYVSALELEGMYLAQLSRANQYLSLALEKKNMLPKPQNINKFANEKLVYQLRMKPFLTVEPSIIPYDQAVERTRNLKFEFCIAAAKNMISTSKKLLEQLETISRDNPELLLLKRSSFGVGITAGIIERASEDLLNTRKIIAEYKNYHWFFPVLTLSTKDDD